MSPRHTPPLDVSSTAEYLGITPRHVRRLVYEQRIAYVKIGSRVRFLQEDLDQFLAERRVDAR